MSTVTCPSCKTVYDKNVIKCPQCQAWRPRADDDHVEGTERDTKNETTSALVVLPMPTPHVASEPARVSVDKVGGMLAQGASQFHELKRLGYQLIAVVGLSQHGKTDFIRSMIEDVARIYGGDTGQQQDVIDAAGFTERTNPGTFNAWKIQAGSRLIAVWDIAGEDFKKIGDGGNLDGDLAEFLKDVLPLCQGVVMTLSLFKIWELWNRVEADKPSDDEMRQGNNLYARNVRAYVRFLELIQLLKSGIGVPVESLKDPARAKAALVKCPRLRIPIVVNFSQADLYPGLKTPVAVKPPIDLGRRMPLPSIEVDPATQDARALAYLYLDLLFTHVRTNALCAHYVYTIGHAGGKIRPDRHNLGCGYPFELVTGLGPSLPIVDRRLVERYYRSDAWKARVNLIIEGKP
jgi:hypothetical protein